jgi:hypothetical protein
LTVFTCFHETAKVSILSVISEEISELRKLRICFFSPSLYQLSYLSLNVGRINVNSTFHLVNLTPEVRQPQIPLARTLRITT